MIVGGGSIGPSEDEPGVDGWTNSDLAVWVFTPEGEFDLTFGPDHNGIVVHSDALGENASDRAMCATVDRDDRLLFAGYGRNPEGQPNLPVWRFNPNGTIDTSFSDDGFLVERRLAGGLGGDMGPAIAVDPSDKIWVVGRSANADGDADMIVLKYNENGSRDLSFNGTGLLVVHNIAGGGSHDGGASVVFDARGNAIIAGGSIDAEGRVVVFLARYFPDGRLDRSFGTAGTGFVFTGPEYSNECRVESLALDADGVGLIATGYCRNAAGYYEMAIWKFE
ncbi:MAG: hypothetical protein KJ811_02850 [Candidatus Margulisbacteria bacterium]|nr:hypothetical protein [Candidatus Margulisiibacteriota bacterium]